jgi:hypothetical protein
MNMIIAKQPQFLEIVTTESDPQERANGKLRYSNVPTRLGHDHKRSVGWISETHRLSLGANRPGNGPLVRLIGLPDNGPAAR